MGRVLALDPGTRRIGVAVSDPARILASPLEVIEGSDPLPRLRELVAHYEPDVVVVGLPTSLSGTEGPAAVAARRFAQEVAEALEVPVELVDERFTTRTAESAMVEGGVRRRERRGKVDKVAAAVILQQYLERQRSDVPSEGMPPSGDAGDRP